MSSGHVAAVVSSDTFIYQRRLSIARVVLNNLPDLMREALTERFRPIWRLAVLHIEQG